MLCSDRSSQRTQGGGVFAHGPDYMATRLHRRPGAEPCADPDAARGFLRQVPAWAISMLAHVVVLVSLALLHTPAHRVEEPRIISLSAPDAEDRFAAFFPAERALEPSGRNEVPEMPAPPDAEVVADSPPVAPADAIPPVVDVGDVAADALPVAIMISPLGAGARGAIGGFGGRGDAATLAARRGGGSDTEAAVDRALAWLGRHQLEDGSWSFDLTACRDCRGACRHSGDPAVSEDRAAATALALLPFLGRGYTHRRGPFREAIDRGIAFLTTRVVRQRGVAYAPTNAHGLYAQGLVGIALSECYALTRDQRLATPTQLVVTHIVKAQDPGGGGWRYRPGQAGDTSVLGWQIMALTSARLAYLDVGAKTFARAANFLDAVQVDAGAAYGYMDRSKPLPGRSAIGLLCRMYLGWKRDHPALRDGVHRLAAIGPTDDLYYDYYATQVMHHMEGDAWVEWNRSMKNLLLRTQATAGHEAGSWYEGVDGGFAAKSIAPPAIAGRLYCTSLATMILEVYYRHLPIYRTQSLDDVPE